MKIVPKVQHVNASSSKPDYNNNNLTDNNSIFEIEKVESLDAKIKPEGIENKLAKSLDRAKKIDYEKYAHQYIKDLNKHWPKGKYKIEKKVGTYMTYMGTQAVVTEYKIYDKKTNKQISYIRYSDNEGNGINWTQYICVGEYEDYQVRVDNGELKVYKNRVGNQRVFYQLDPDKSSRIHIHEYSEQGQKLAIYEEWDENNNIKNRMIGYDSKTDTFDEEYQYDEFGDVKSHRKGDAYLDIYDNVIKIKSTINGQEEYTYPIVDELYADIHAHTFKGIFPTTGKKFAEHIEKINEDNVYEILINYGKKTGKNSIDDYKEYNMGEIPYDDWLMQPEYRGDIIGWMEYFYNREKKLFKKESLFRSIDNEIGMSWSNKKKYIKHILNALKSSNIIKDNIFTSEIDKMLDYAEDLSIGEIEKCFDEIVFRIDSRNRRMKGTITKPDGIIDENSEIEQGELGDCWLLSSIKALSLSEDGRKILKNSLELMSNGDIQVSLRGVGKTYLIKKEEIDVAKEFSLGDGDIRAIELAVEKYRKDSDTTIDGGSFGEGLWLLGAIKEKPYEGCILANVVAKQINNTFMYERFANGNPDDIILADIEPTKEYISSQDINGLHAVCIVKITENEVEYFDSRYKKKKKCSLSDFKRMCVRIKKFVWE